MKKNSLSVFMLFVLLCWTSVVLGQGQDTLVKKVRVDWDKKLFESPLPYDREFLLYVYSKQVSEASKLSSLQLVRYLDRRIFYFYEQPQSLLSSSGSTPESNAILTTSSSKVVKAGAAPTTITVEKQYSGDISDPTYYVAIYRVSPLRANFYYCLLDKTGYVNARDKHKVANLIHDTPGKVNTYLSVEENTKRRVTAIIGLAAFTTKSATIRPNLGLRYNLYPISRNMQYEVYKNMYFSNWRQELLSHLSLDFAVTLASLKDSASNRFDLFSKQNVMTGLGYRIGDSFFLSAGRVWYNKKTGEPNKQSERITSNWYISASFDWDIGKTFDSLKKGLGAAL